LLENSVSNSSGKQIKGQGAILEGLATGMESLKSKSPESINNFKEDQNLLINTFFGHPSVEVRKGSLDMLRVIGLNSSPETKTAIDKSLKIMADRSLTDQKRTEAINFLALDRACSI
jgi:hypothetical protein